MNMGVGSFKFQLGRRFSIFLNGFLFFSLGLIAYGQTVSPSVRWNSTVEEAVITAGEASVEFSFSVTNISAKELSIDKVVPSCGCTVARLPALPWILPPGEHGLLQFTTDLRGKMGTFTKSASVHTSAGVQVLTMKVIMPASSSTNTVATVSTIAMSGTRAKNQELAKTDHQAVFKNDCASCHAEPAKGKLGLELYTVACGICHDAEHRAEAVPLLGKSPLNSNPAYWRTWISFGKPGSMMPGFSKSLGGPLESTQIESLAAFLAAKHGANSAQETVSRP